MAAAIEELKALVLAKYPDARFRVYRSEEPEGIYLGTIVDIEEPSDVM